MSNTPSQEPPGPELSFGSGQTLHSRPNQLMADPSTSKRVCFYKSGDYKFSGHRLVINNRTFKSYDALLDALSKKVPLPFGVRTITTPRGTHLVRTLDDLLDGGSYVCSDQKRVKPLNLEEVKRRQVPWNTTRPLSAGRRQRLQLGKKSDAVNRPAKVTERVAVRTPKKLVVISNRDATFKRTIVLHRRSAPTFDALLDYLSQILQFPVLKLYSTDGRRVDGLAALILCSGVVVAAGNEPFKSGNYGFQRIGQITQAVLTDTGSGLQPKARNNKSVSSGRGSRNFSLSSERFIVEQVNKSLNGSTNGQVLHHSTPFEAETRRPGKSLEPRGSDGPVKRQRALIIPHEDDIEKSFRVNEDGSMTVEMKVHLTIKEEELLHWTTTLSRSSLSRKTVYASITESANSSPDSNNAVAKRSFSTCEEETKEENCPAGPGVTTAGYTSSTEKAKPVSRRIPTPGPRHVKKTASVESMMTVTSAGVQEHTMGHYTYMERMGDGETTEQYCLVRHSSSSSNRPVPKPRKTVSAGLIKEGSRTKRPSGLAEVLKIETNGTEVRETVMHIFENQGCYDNYYANEGYSSEYAPLHASTSAADSKPPTVSSSDCDIDISPADSLQRQGEEMLSLSSDHVDPEHKTRPTASSGKPSTPKNNRLPKSVKKNVIKSSRNLKGSTTNASDHDGKGAVVITSTKSKNSSTSDKKNLTSSESAKSGKNSNRAEKSPIKLVRKGAKLVKADEDILNTRKDAKGSPSQGQNKSKTGTKTSGHNVNTPSIRPQMKKNISGILQNRKALQPGKKTPSHPKSVVRIASPKMRSGQSQSFSRPSPLPPPCEVRQYVEDWLEKVNQDRELYSEEALTDASEAQAKVEFQIGGDSEENEKNEDCADDLCQSLGEHDEQQVTFLRAPLSSVRDDDVEHQDRRSETSRLAEAIFSVDHDSDSSASKEKIKPIMEHICLAVQSIKRASGTNTPPSPNMITSTDKFSTQVASVFGSSCKLFLSFLSVMILQDYISGSQSRSASEATLMMESLQKLSAAEDEEEQRVSLEDMRNKASFQFKKSWKDFMNLSDRTEAETELTLSVKGVDAFEDQCLIIDELMGELNISQDLRELISSTVRLAPSFYPVEKSVSLESETNQSDKAIEPEMGEEEGQGEMTEDEVVANVQEEWDIEKDDLGEEPRAVQVQDKWGRVEVRETEVSEEELKEEEGEDETNEEIDERKGVEETEEEEDAYTEEEESHEVEEKLLEGTEERDGKDEIQTETESEDINMGGEETVAFTGIDMANSVNEEQADEKTDDSNEENKREEDEALDEDGQDGTEDSKSTTTCEEENDRQSDRSAEEVGRSDEIHEVEEDGLDEDFDSEDSVEEEGSVLHEEDHDTNTEERANVHSKSEENSAESPVKYSSEDQCEEDKGNGTDTITDDGEEHCEGRSNNLPHPVEISQELLDFVNSALQSSSLIFTYDARGNVRLEPDNCRVVKTKQALIPKRRKDSQYGLKVLPSPCTSELSDYRPETSQSGGSKPHESIDITTDSEEDAWEKSLVHPQKTNAEPANTGSSAEAFQTSQIQSRGCFSSFSSGTEPPKQDPPQPATEVIECASASLVEDCPDGILIDQGRWLLKENHLIRKSPPLSSGMYDNADSTSIDSSQENGEDAVTHTQTQVSPLTYFSSSEIEELAKPKTPKCTYFTMPHGSDSDPFMDDSSLKSGENATSGGKRGGFRVSPTIDTSKTWASKNASLSSFTSVEFKMPDGKVHPEGESSSVTQARRTSSGGRRVLQGQDSEDTLHVRCSQYCPIL